MNILTYLLVGFVGWCALYAIMTRTERWPADSGEFMMGLVMSTAFWPVFVISVPAMWAGVGLYILVTGRKD